MCSARLAEQKKAAGPEAAFGRLTILSNRKTQGRLSLLIATEARTINALHNHDSWESDPCAIAPVGEVVEVPTELATLEQRRKGVLDKWWFLGRVTASAWGTCWSYSVFANGEGGWPSGYPADCGRFNSELSINVSGSIPFSIASTRRRR